jgi:8-oxo-dGTP pyrophosphatase MutT (NUDIX family)
VHLVLLRVFRMFPRRLRRQVVRVLAPSFTLGAICVIERDDGAILLVRQVYRRGWGLPGGLMQRREGIEDCARREVEEEVGLPIELVGEPGVVVDPVPRRIDIVYRARVRLGCYPAGARPASPEIAEVRWFSPEELPQLQHETVSALIALARQDRSTRLQAVQPVTRPAS